MGKIKIAGSLLVVLFATSLWVQAQSLPIPEGRRLREIVADKYPDGKLLIGATTGSWGLNEPIGEIMDREFSYVTPENDFKQAVVRANPNSWNWSRADAWLQHIIDNDQVLRIHGPISPQCSNWALDDSRTAEELSHELDTFMTALCMRYNGVEGIKYLDVVNEIALDNGQWFGPRPGTDVWENPWFIIGQDDDPNQTPLYVRQAFAIANEHAPDLKLILNNHCHPGSAGMEKVKETILYLRDRGYRVDGLGWQAHVETGWATEANLQHLRDVIDWCQSRNLEFHVTEASAWIMNQETQTLEEQAYTYKAILDVLLEKLDSLTIGWNTWHITDASGWQTELIPSLFDDQYLPKPAYYAVQLALESKGEYSVSVKVKHVGTGEDLEGCEITLNDETKYTDATGDVTFEPMAAGYYELEVKKEFMKSVLNEHFNVYSDTVITILMDSAKYKVSYRLVDSYSMADIPFVKVTIGSKVGTTDANGTVNFFLTAGTYSSTFNKSNYKPCQSEHHITSDTLLTTVLEMTHATIRFWIKDDGDIPVNGALVLLDNDSLYTNALGLCKFEFVRIDSSYVYNVSAEHYNSILDVLTLKTDTTIYLQLTKPVSNFGIISDPSVNDTFIYPNPANDHLYVRSGTDIDHINIYNTAGISVNQYQPRASSCQIDISDLPGGYYWIKIGWQGASQIIQPFIVH